MCDLQPTRCALVTAVTSQLSLDPSARRQQTQRDSFLPPRQKSQAINFKRAHICFNTASSSLQQSGLRTSPSFPRVPVSLPVLAQFIIRDRVDPSASVCLFAQGQHNQSLSSSGVVQTGLRLRGARFAVPERITAQRAGVQKCLVHFCLLPCVS